MSKLTAEHQRLLAHRARTANWRKWGPYLSERAWGTVREDYSQHGMAWDYFPHDHARSRTYRWNEDGIAGISDRYQYLCFALALWNEHDPILKERFFGLAGSEGNHGEDVKEVYFYLDNTPTHSYMKMVYKYPFAYPYANLIVENGQRDRHDSEYEITDTCAFNHNRYFDVEVEYAKAGQEDMLIRITIHNRAEVAHTCHLLPILWFRNTWSWGYDEGPMHDVPSKPQLSLTEEGHIVADHPTAGIYTLYTDLSTLTNVPKFLFTENETNFYRFYGTENNSPYVKDAFHRHIINRESNVVNPDKIGTKSAIWYRDTIPAQSSATYRLRLSSATLDRPFHQFDATFRQRKQEADDFYETVYATTLSAEERAIQRQAYAGILWSKQLYYYDIPQWLDGDPAHPPPAPQRKKGRNHDWRHLHNFDVISMPDKWEYPWYAAWDLAFHSLPLAQIDPDFAKRQLILMTREWYMHPNGQIPAYEWNFNDVNPPVHAWGAWHVYQLDKQHTGQADRDFLESIFHKCLLNFTWWVNRKDATGRNIFQGGFLGLDNIGVFDRSAPLPMGGHLDQADGTAWMGFYCLTMLQIALELAKENPVYEDTATKFFEHFLWIAHAMSNVGGYQHSLWDEADGFFYDVIHLHDKGIIPLKVRSLVGLVPLFATLVLKPETLANMPAFNRRLHWFVENRPRLTGNMANVHDKNSGDHRLLSILTEERLRQVLAYLLDETEFLSPYGIRSLSKYHAENPYTVYLGGQAHTVDYEPGESHSGLFGGNSNWRGPIWLPMNYLIVESLETLHRYYGDEFTVELPTGSGNHRTLAEVAEEIKGRLVRLFVPDNAGNRPINAYDKRFRDDPHWRDYVLFYEYFHGETGKGLGASHQTGWTGLIANLLTKTSD